MIAPLALSAAWALAAAPVQDSGAVVHLIDRLGDDPRATLDSPALTPPPLGESSARLDQLDCEGELPDGRVVFVLPLPLDRSAPASLRTDPEGARPQLIAGSRFFAGDRLTAFRKLRSRTLLDGRSVFVVDVPTELKLPIERMGRGGQLALTGDAFRRETADALTLRYGEAVIAARAWPETGTPAAFVFELPDALGPTTGVLSIARAGKGADELRIAGYEIVESAGRDRVVLPSDVDRRATRLTWRSAPPAPVLALPASATRETSSDVILLPGRIGISGVAAERLRIDGPDGALRFEDAGGGALEAELPAALLARIVLAPGPVPEGAAAPRLLQPQACRFQRFPPMRGADVAEPVRPLVDHWQAGLETRRGVMLAVGSTLRVPIPDGAWRLECELGAVALFPAPPGTPLPTIVVSSGAPEREFGRAPIATSAADLATARAGTPASFEPLAWTIPADAPRELVIRVEAAPAALLASQLFSVVLAEPRLVATSRAPRRPNLLVFVVDTLRADHVHCCGGARETTPSVDAFARDAIVFRQGQSQAPWTRPAIATLFTGLIPEHHEVAHDTRLAREAATLAERMRAAGYETAAFSANAQVHAAGLDFEQGFDRFVGFDHDHELARADEVLDPALPWLEQRRDRPFFLYVHVIDPHDPYDPPAETRGTFERAYHGHIDDAQTGIGPLERLFPLDDADRAHLIDLYDEEVLFADLQFGKLIEHVKKLGLYDDTVILFLSDHGEELLDHGRLGHTRRLWNEALHVPMVLKLAGADAPRGKVVDAVVRTMDWLPTLARLCHLPGEGADCEGVDLAVCWRGDDPPELDALAQTEPDLESFLHAGWKILSHEASRGDAAVTSLYHLADDPAETNDLATVHPELVTALRRGAKQFKGSLAARGFKPLRRTATGELDPAVDRALRALGYATEEKK